MFDEVEYEEVDVSILLIDGVIHLEADAGHQPGDWGDIPSHRSVSYETERKARELALQSPLTLEEAYGLLELVNEMPFPVASQNSVVLCAAKNCNRTISRTLASQPAFYIRKALVGANKLSSEELKVVLYVLRTVQGGVYHDL